MLQPVKEDMTMLQCRGSVISTYMQQAPKLELVIKQNMFYTWIVRSWVMIRQGGGPVAEERERARCPLTPSLAEIIEIDGYYSANKLH